MDEFGGGVEGVRGGVAWGRVGGEIGAVAEVGAAGSVDVAAVSIASWRFVRGGEVWLSIVPCENSLGIFLDIPVVL